MIPSSFCSVPDAMYRVFSVPPEIDIDVWLESLVRPASSSSWSKYGQEVVVQPLAAPTPGRNAASTSAAFSKRLEPTLLDSPNAPKPTLKDPREAPGRPRLVVMITTPFEARPP